MKICLNASCVNENLWPLVDNEPVALVKLAGKYLIEYILESCTRSQINSVLVVGGQYCDTLKDRIGNGRKWGMEITYQENIKNANELLIINIDSLFNLPITDLIEIIKQNQHELNKDTTDYSDSRIFKISDYSSFYDICMKLVNSELNECVIDPHQYGYKVIEGSRVIYSQENIKNGCAYIGDRTRVSSTSTLSSDVVVGAEVVIDDYAQLTASIIMDNTYIGKMLKVDQSIVKGNHLISLKNKSCTKITDDILINDLRVKPNNKGFMKRMINRATPISALSS